MPAEKSPTTIDVATEADIPVLVDLLKILFTQEAEFEPDAVKQDAGLRQIISEPAAGIIFVARQGSTVVGMVSLLFIISTAEGGRVALLEDVVVHPSSRRKGIGSLVLIHAIEYAKNNGLTRITLQADRLNERAIKFYRRHGFEMSQMVPMRLAPR